MNDARTIGLPTARLLDRLLQQATDSIVAAEAILIVEGKFAPDGYQRERDELGQAFELIEKARGRVRSRTDVGLEEVPFQR